MHIETTALCCSGNRREKHQSQTDWELTRAGLLTPSRIARAPRRQGTLRRANNARSAQGHATHSGAARQSGLEQPRCKRRQQEASAQAEPSALRRRGLRRLNGTRERCIRRRRGASPLRSSGDLRCDCTVDLLLESGVGVGSRTSSTSSVDSKRTVSVVGIGSRASSTSSSKRVAIACALKPGVVLSRAPSTAPLLVVARLSAN